MRAFFIGNGPSLTAEDLDLLKDEVTFGCNRIDLIYPETEWRPTHYVFTDRFGNPEWEKELARHVNYDKYDCWVAPEIYALVPNQKRIRPLSERETEHPGTLYPTAFLCNKLNINELYLIGCDMDYELNDRAGVGDYSFSETDKNHFSPNYAPKDGCAAPIVVRRANGLMMASHWQTWTMNLVETYNCTRGGSDKLPWERRVLEDIL